MYLEYTPWARSLIDIAASYSSSAIRLPANGQSVTCVIVAAYQEVPVRRSSLIIHDVHPGPHSGNVTSDYILAVSFAGDVEL